MTRAIYVNFDYDDESRNWAFHCDDPAIVGGGATLEDAQARAGEALTQAVGGQWLIDLKPVRAKSKYHLAAIPA